jgi:hypothetical protein
MCTYTVRLPGRGRYATRTSPDRHFADPLFAALDEALAAGERREWSRFADVTERFDPAADEVATLCRLTLLCAAGDARPSDAGYRVVADFVPAAVPEGFALRDGGRS